MTRQEVQKLLMTIQAAYPNYKPENKTVVIDTWHALLNNYTYNEVSGALQAFILTNTKGFAPSIGQVVEKIQTTTQPAELGEMEAWDLVANAISQGIYHSEREFNKLPPTVQKAVGSSGRIRSWAMSCTSEEIHSVVQSNFMRSYRAIVMREKEQEKLPPALRQITEKTFEALDAVKPIEEIKPEKQTETSNVPEWVTERLRSGMFA